MAKHEWIVKWKTQQYHAWDIAFKILNLRQYALVKFYNEYAQG